MEDFGPAKAHRASSKGRKAAKKVAADKKRRGLDSHRHNAKAFLPKSGVAALKRANRNRDLEQKRLHVPLVDRSDPDSVPPVIVGVVGPPQVGKTTLIRSLVKHYTRQTMTHVKGPVTVVSGKSRRLTFIECPNDINAMIDVAKVADLVLLLIDASFGFEMDCFEFLNICQVHGFPKIMGVLTHLDLFKEGKKLRKTRQRLKHRFWTEVYQGAKLFYLSGLQYGRYNKTEIKNLARFISVQKFRPLIWRNTHPYMLVDRLEDITDPQRVHDTPTVDRKVVFYGYLHGTHLKKDQTVHIPGCGDFAMDDVSILDDPCPLPSSEVKRSLASRQRLLYAPMSDVGDITFDKDAVYIDLQPEAKRGKGGESGSDDGVGGDDEGEGSSDGSSVDRMVLEEDSSDADQDPEAMRTHGGRIVRRLVDSRVGIDERATANTFQLISGGRHISSGDVKAQMQAAVSKKPEKPLRRAVNFDTIGKQPVAAPESDSSDEHDDRDDDDEQDSNSDEVNEPRPINNEAFLDASYRSSRALKRQAGSGGRVVSGSGSDASEEESGGTGAGESMWKQNLVQKALASFKERQALNLMDIVYGEAADPLKLSRKRTRGRGASDSDSDSDSGSGSSESGGLFRRRKRAGTRDARLNTLDSARPAITSLVDLRARFQNHEIREIMSQRFRSLADDDLDGSGAEEGGGGSSSSSSSESSSSQSSSSQSSSSGRGLDAYGADPEALRAAKLAKRKAFERSNTQRRARAAAGVAEGSDEEGTAGFGMSMSGSSSSGDGSTGDSSSSESSSTSSSSSNAHNIAVKMGAEMDAQKQLNLSHFANLPEEQRALYEGFRQGLYVRIEVSGVPCELMIHFDPLRPILVGGVQPTETTKALLKVRVKRHRWHRRILKSHDPLIVSLGWRRFQTTPIYSIWNNGRQRFLKYTPEHMHCEALFYGISTPPGTAFCAFTTLSSTNPGFRVSATGTVLEMNETFTIQKKLKLTGVPVKIHKHTAFIKDMFTSVLEVAKFEGGAIRTVSGIRGQVKKAVTTGYPAGTFRATFEDKILLSDIVFMRTWYPVEPKKFCYPVKNLLLPADVDWEGMRTVGAVRFAKGELAPHNPDSTYATVKRPPRKFNALRVPKSIESALPFAAKPKQAVAVNKANRKKRKNRKIKKHTAVVMDPAERKAYALLQQISTVKNVKEYKRREKKRREKARYQAKKQAEEEARAARKKMRTKEFFRKNKGYN